MKTELYRGQIIPQCVRGNTLVADVYSPEWTMNVYKCLCWGNVVFCCSGYNVSELEVCMD